MDKTPFNLSQVLGLTPEAAVEFFRQKGFKIGFDHRDVWQQEHQAAFTVAKAMQLDLLVEIRDQVDAALADGTTFEAFKAALKPNLVKRGWWGRAMMGEEPGQGRSGRAQCLRRDRARRRQAGRDPDRR